MQPILWYIIVGLLVGWAAGSIMKGLGHRPLFDMVLGVVGAVAAGNIVGALGVAAQRGPVFTVIVAAVGAAVVVTFGRLASGYRKAPRRTP